MCEAARKPVCLCVAQERGKKCRRQRNRSHKCSYSICALITVLGRPMRLDLCWREGARSVEGSRRAEGGGTACSRSRGGPGRTPSASEPHRISPSSAALSRTCWPHGRRGDAFHPVRVVSKYVDRSSLSGRGHAPGVSCPCDQDAVPSVEAGTAWERLQKRLADGGVGHGRRLACMLASFPLSIADEKRSPSKPIHQENLDLEHQPVGLRQNQGVHLYFPEGPDPRQAGLSKELSSDSSQAKS